MNLIKIITYRISMVSISWKPIKNKLIPCLRNRPVRLGTSSSINSGDSKNSNDLLSDTNLVLQNAFLQKQYLYHPKLFFIKL